MKLLQLIQMVDDIKPNAFTNDTKTGWVNECEGLVQTEVMLIAIEDIIAYDYAADAQTTLLAAPPHDKLYWAYLTALIDFANGEYNKYQNTMQLFNSHFGEYMRWYAQRYRPADGEAEAAGYYISAYGIAVKHGYTGTEEEWLLTLKGEQGDGVDMRYDNNKIQWQRDGDTDWSDLLDMEDIQTEVVAQTLAEAEASAAAAAASENAAAASESAAGASATEAATSETAAAASENAAETAAASALASKNAAQTAQTAAESAQADAEAASTSAQGYATTSGSNATAAAASATQAQNNKTEAETASNTAISAKNAATDSESAAAASATAAASSKTAAATSETAAAASENAAETAAASALASKNAAQSAQTAAEASETAAEGYSTTASTKAAEAAQSASEAAGDATISESWAVGGTGARPGENTNNAKYWSDAASAAAGGGVTSFNARSGAVSPQSGDYDAGMVGADPAGTAAGAVSAHNGAADAHASLLAGKSNTGHTHDDRYYTESEADTLLAGKSATTHTHTAAQVGADASGTAASAVSTHNSSATAHSSRFSAKADVADLTAHTGNTGNPHGVTATQAGADPTGTAASAVTAHNSAEDAHASLLAGKSNTGHTHDDRYYTESETDTMLAGKAASSHNHSASNITSGTLSIARGGTGAASAAAARTALGAQATLTAGTNITISGSTISATGGILPRIIATAPTGSTVTCAKGSTTLTATEASGTWTFDVPDYGTWAVTATLSGQTATKSVVVDQVKQYAASLVYLSDTFSANTWEDIIDACQSGSVPAAWVVGNQKAMTINGASYTITIIGKGHDTYASGGTAPLTFQLQDCYGTTYNMNSSNTNNGGWTSCAMRATHLPAILALMPAEVQAGIREVNKLTSAGNQSATINTTADKLFLLSEVETFGNVTYAKAGEGSQYAYYSAGNSKVKKFNGGANIWWERSPYGSDTTYFCGVGSNGSAINNYASSANGVAFGFCF